jgi:hypothetical protein
MSDIRPRPKPRRTQRTEQEWVQHFAIKESVIVDSVIQYGIDLLQAKSELPHGRWLPFLAAIGISARTASERMAIGRMGLRSNQNMGRFDLPTRIGALAEISRWPDEQVTRAVESGVVSADATERDLKGWRRQHTAPDAATPPVRTPTATASERQTCPCCGQIIRNT